MATFIRINANEKRLKQGRVTESIALCPITQSCPTLCDPMNCSLPGSSVLGIFQTRILQWVAISFSRGSSGARDWTCVSCISRIGRQILYHWARERPLKCFLAIIKLSPGGKFKSQCLWRLTAAPSPALQPSKKKPGILFRSALLYRSC